MRKAGDAVAAVIAAGIIPAGLEMMDKPMTAAVEDFARRLRPDGRGHPAVRERRHTEEVEEEIGRMSAVLQGATHRPCREPERGRAHALLERAQERFPRQRPHQP